MEYWERRPQEIITTLWKGAVRRLDDLADLASSRSAGVHFNALIPVGRARDNPDILPSVEEKHTARRHIEALARTHNGVLTDLHCLTQGDCRQGIDLFCKGRFSIDPQGNVHPCEFLSRVSFGNVFHEQLSAIISRAQATPFIQAREEGFKRQVHLDVADPFDYHTAICHPLAARLHG
jgi:MoaA/NifB/PqqE/SkfB family radical SAM enzyme